MDLVVQYQEKLETADETEFKRYQGNLESLREVISTMEEAL